MAQFFDDFDGETIDAFPSGWTATWATGDTTVIASSGVSSAFETAAGARAVKVVGSGFARRAFFPDAYESVSGNAEIRSLIHYPSTTDSNQIANAIVRGNVASSGSRSGYAALLRFGTNNCQIRRKNSGSSTTLASGTISSSNFDADNLAEVLFRVTDDVSDWDLDLYVFPYGDAVPGTPTVTATDATHSSGFLGQGAMHGSSSDRHHIGWVGIGTGGDSAPREAVGGPTGTYRGLMMLGAGM